MKRSIAILLTIILLSTCLIIPTSAESKTNNKLTPALREALYEQKTGAETSLDIIVYFSDEFSTVDGMPSWPDLACVGEYTEYVVIRNDELLYEVYKGREDRVTANSGTDYSIEGCVIIYNFCPDDIYIPESSEHVRLIDVYDPLETPDGGRVKYTYKLRKALNARGNDDYILVWVNNSTHLKTLAEMPSWQIASPSQPTEKNRIEEFHSMREAAYAEYRAYLNEVEDSFISEAFEGIDDYKLFTSGFGSMVLAAVKVCDLSKIASRDCVSYIEYSENYIIEPEENDPYHPTGELDLKAELIRQYNIPEEALEYEEICYRVSDDAPFWVLVKAARIDLCQCAVLYSEVVGGRPLTASGWKWNPFTFDYGIYDGEERRFYDLTEIDFDRYNGLIEVWQELELSSFSGRIYEWTRTGDADGDDQISVMDATKIQRVIAGVDTRYSMDSKSADADEDGEVTVLDATRIQRYLAGLSPINGLFIDEIYVYYPDTVKAL